MIQKQTVPNVLKAFAHLLSTEIKDWKLEIPEKFGRGYCIGFRFNTNIRMIISNYELNEDIIVENIDIDHSKKTLFFKFQNIFPATETLAEESKTKMLPSVLIGTSSLNTDTVIPIHTNTATINIEINADYLSELFEISEESTILYNLLQNKQPLLFEQMMYPSLEKIVNEIISESISKTFKLLFLRIKAEELICRLLIELEKRDTKQLYTLNNNDVEKIYKVKQQMLENLSIPPVINDLAVSANMSPTKLKNLFKQIFGNSIFNYYQEFRMKEAAILLKQGDLSVSDVGYKLGFTNLSHFSKVFAAHIGVKPKQYSKL
ncbi:AraC family transcriptional regulator [uncultured Flavobacterium sp.]|uniref:helix-turn-helix domain-containing protein n=1 Tax=uncultured Flavobacterium sp. TaxID=165435 RepID=UPI0030813D72